MKRIVYMCALLMMVLCVSGCDNNKNVAEILLVGVIENTTHGVVSSEYADQNAWIDPESGASKQRDELRAEMISYLNAVYGYDDYTHVNLLKVRTFENVYRKLLNEFKYEISELEEVGEGEYKATITYKPFALGDALDDTAYSFYTEVEEGDSSVASGPEAFIDDKLFKLLNEKAEEFAKDIKYSEEVSVDVTITLTDKKWSLSESFYSEFLVGIMDLNIDDIMYSDVDEDTDLNIDETTDSETNEEE